jgi:hypothetical protein
MIAAGADRIDQVLWQPSRGQYSVVKRQEDTK